MFKASTLTMLAAGMALATAAQRTDLSGTWKLNLAKSFLGADHPNRDYEMTKIIVQEAGMIKQTDIALHVSIVNILMPDSRTSMELIPDGQMHEVTEPAPFPRMPPLKMQTVVEWQGGTLLVTESGQSFGGPSTMRRRYFLSNDGSRLIELIEGHSAFADTEQRLVFDKQ